MESTRKCQPSINRAVEKAVAGVLHGVDVCSSVTGDRLAAGDLLAIFQAKGPRQVEV